MEPRALHLRVIAAAIAAALVLPALVFAVVAIRGQFTHRSAPTVVRTRAPIAGFSTIAFSVSDNPTTRCALLAATEAAREQGMQHRADLAGYDAMLFTFGDADVTTQFINHNVPIPLSIGWYAADESLVDHAVMAACPAGINCPLFHASRPYRTAMETRRGGLEGLGLTAPGAVLHVGGSCS